MAEKRRHPRVRPRGLVSGKAKIFADTRSPAMDCTVVDESAGGACLQVHGAAAIPNRFIYLHGAVKKSARLVWQRGRTIGVAF